MERERKKGGPVCTLQILLFRPFFDISVIYTKYVAHILGSATEIITIKITLVDGFVTFNILNCKTYFHLSIKSNFDNRNTIYQNKVYGKVFSLPCLQALVSVIINIKGIKNKWKTRLAWTNGPVHRLYVYEICCAVACPWHAFFCLFTHGTWCGRN